MSSKRYKEALKIVAAKETYGLADAVEVLSQTPRAKFDETVELAVSLGVDPKQSDQMVRGTVSLPHGSGKKVTVLVFTEKPEEALAAGADYAGFNDMIKKVLDGWTGFDVAIATPSAMKEVRQVARVLGPRGLMPNPKSGTVVEDVAAGIQAVKAGRVEFKMDKTANLSVIVGKRSFGNGQLLENIQSAIDAIVKVKPATCKNRYMKRVVISSTMSPGVKIDSKEYASL